MIRQKIRIVNNEVSFAVFNTTTVFTNMQLYELSPLPAWISVLTIPYITLVKLSPTVLGTFSYFFTLGGSPSIADACLTIEVVDSLTDTTDSCVSQESFLIDSVTNSLGYAQLNSLDDFNVMPKIGEYVYLSDTSYLGHHEILMVVEPATVVINTPYTATAQPTMYFFNRNTSICLVWITREGGRASSIFDKRKDFGVNTGESKLFDNNGSLKYINRGKNFDTVNVFKTGISNDEVDLIESLRYSIQAWEYDINLNTMTPILIDPTSFNKYSTKNKMNEINLKYRIATYKEIQSQ